MILIFVAEIRTSTSNSDAIPDYKAVCMYSQCLLFFLFLILSPPHQKNKSTKQNNPLVNTLVYEFLLRGPLFSLCGLREDGWHLSMCYHTRCGYTDKKMGLFWRNEWEGLTYIGTVSPGLFFTHWKKEKVEDIRVWEGKGKKPELAVLDALGWRANSIWREILLLQT